MPTFKVKTPDGSIITVNAPEGATQQDAIEYAASVWKPKRKEVDTELTTAEKVAQYLPDIPQTAVDVAAGASGIMRGTSKLLGLGEGIWPTSAANKESTARTVGEILDPTALAIGGGALKAAQLAPKLGAVGQGLLGGAAGGATVGGLSEEGNAKMGGVVGGAIGGAIPIVSPAIRGAGRIVSQAVSPVSRRAEAGRILKEAAGDRPVIQALEKGRTLGPTGRIISPTIISGQTAGQAAVEANAPTFSALQGIVEQTAPEVAYAKTLAQREARAKAIQSFAKTEADLNAAVASRGAQADANYAKAFQTALKKDKEISSVLSNPYVEEVLPNVRKLVKAKGTHVSTTEQLQMIKKELDAKIAGTPAGKPSDNETRAIIDVQNKLVDWLTKKNPEYATALQEYATASKPIAEMRIGQTAQRILESPVGGKERAASFVKAVEDEYNLLRKSTGYTRAELAQQLQPQNLQKLQNIAKELDIDATFAEQKSVGRAAAQAQLGMETKLPNFLNNAWTIANNLLNKLQMGAKEKTLKELAVIMQDPIETAKLMRQANKKEQNAIKFLKRAQMAGALAGTELEKQ